MRQRKKGIGGTIITILIIILLLRACGGGDDSIGEFIMDMIGFFFSAGIVLALVVGGITAAVIYFSEKDRKYRGRHDPPNVTPKAAREAEAAAKAARAAAKNQKQAGANGQAGADGSGWAAGTGAGNAGQAAGTGAGNAGQAAGAGAGAAANARPARPDIDKYPVADRSKTYEKTPEGVRQMLSDYKIDYILGPIAADALKQKDRLEKQQESYRRLVERRFGKGTLSAEKYLSVEKSSNDALQNSYLRIANRMEAFNTKEYLWFTSGAYKTDSIPDHVQEQRQELYDQNLHYMKDCLADNEHILAGMDRLMLKLADSDTADEVGISEEIEALEQQLAYYRKNY